jgi:hypothetical protein
MSVNKANTADCEQPNRDLAAGPKGQPAATRAVRLTASRVRPEPLKPRRPTHHKGWGVVLASSV